MGWHLWRLLGLFFLVLNQEITNFREIRHQGSSLNLRPISLRNPLALEVSPFFDLHHQHFCIQGPLTDVFFVILDIFFVFSFLSGFFALILIQKIKFTLSFLDVFLIELFALFFQFSNLLFQVFYPSCSFLELWFEVKEFRLKQIRIFRTLKIR